MLAITIFAIFSTGIVYLTVDNIDRDTKVELESEGLFYAQEGIEATINMRDKSFLLLTNGDHGLNLSNDTWSFVAAPENIDDFYSRTITIEDVYRDVNNDIASSGTYDPDTKKITSEVSWLLRGVVPRSVSLVTYLSNWTGDDWIETTCTEFEAGTHTETQTIITASPPTDNCALQLLLEEAQSEFFTSTDLGDHANDVSISGNYAYLANNKTQTGLTIVNVSNPQSPSITTNVNIGKNGRKVLTNGSSIFLGVQSASNGLAIVDVSNPPLASLTSNLDIGAYGNDMAQVENYLYMGTSQDTNSLKIIDVTNKSAPTITNTIDFKDVVEVIKINGNYAYVGLDEDFEGLRVLDITSPANPIEVAALNVGEEVSAIKIQGLFAYVGIEDELNSLKVVNISNPLNPSVVATLNTGGQINDLTIVGDYLYAAIDNQNAGLAAINISNPLSPTLAYNIDILGKGTGIDSDGTHLYISSDTNNKGLVIVGTTVAQITTSGTYLSSEFDTSSTSTRYNFIEWDHTEVPGGSVKFQIRTADTLGNLATATWVGSDGTSSTYYENPRTQITTDPSSFGTRYFQYKIFIDSDGVTTPSIESVRINYTP